MDTTSLREAYRVFLDAAATVAGTDPTPAARGVERSDVCERARRCVAWSVAVKSWAGH